MTKYETQFLTLYRSGMDAMMDMTKVCLEAAERMQSHQLKAISDGLSDTAETDKKIKSLKSFDELIELQGDFGPARAEQVIGWWSGLYAGAARNQVEIAKQAQLKAWDFARSCRATLDSAPAGADPVVAPLKSAVTALCSVYALTSRATEEATRLATTQIEAAGATRHAGNGESRRKAA